MTQRPRPRRRLLDRLVLATLAAGLGAGVLGAVLLQRSARETALVEAQERNLLAAEQYAVRLDGRVDSLLGELRLVATRQIITDVAPEAVAEMRVVLRVSPTYDELILYDRSGSAVAAAASRFLADPSQYPARPGLAADAVGGEVVVVQRTVPPMVELAVPVENPPGTVVGTLLARSSLEKVSAPIEDVLAADAAVPFLVDEDGIVLAHRDRSRVLEPADSAPADDALLVATATPSRLPGTVVVEQPERVALAEVGARRRDLIVILAATVLATVIAVIAAGELLLRPLRPLTDVVVRIGRGERDVGTAGTGFGEIGVLGLEVDRMVERLDQREQQLRELQELSLLVGSSSDRRSVSARIAGGAASLVGADGSAVVALPPANGGLPGRTFVEAVAGRSLAVGRAEAAAAEAVRSVRLLRRPSDGTDPHLLAVILRGSDDEPLGVLVVHRRDRPFAMEDEDLLGAFASFAAVALDNARRLALQRDLIEQLQEAVDRRRDLIGTITHEFRTPLACIEGFSAALLDGWSDYDDEERQDLIARIGRHSEELDELVSRFLDFAVTERGALSAQVGTIALDRAVQQAVSALAPVLADRPVVVEVPDLVVEADPALLRRTLTNLLSNAAKYSPSGTIVTVSAAADGALARVEVVDQGAGLTGEEAARAFEPFWRGGGATTRAARGAGLGLALVAEYVRAMGGTAGVTSAPGRGSTFFFTLPLATVPAEPARDGEAAGS